MDTTAQGIGRFLECRLKEMGRNAVITYGQLVAAFDDLPPLTDAWTAHPLCNMFGELDLDDAAFGRPFRTAIVVAQETQMPGDGFFKMYVKHRDPKARCRTADDRMKLHLKELNELDKHYKK